MKALPLLTAVLSLLTAPAFANALVLGSVPVTSPAAGTQVASPFTLSATAATCSSVKVAAMGYSLDSSSDTTIVMGSQLYTAVPASNGAHILHVKSWGAGGAACDTDVPITVSGTATVVNGAVTVSLPKPGAEVVAPFALSATDTVCGPAQVVTMGYSLDSSTNTTVVKGQSLNANVAALPGAHILHVKSWGPNGAACVSDVPITVVSDPTASVPSSALVFRAVQWNTNWQGVHDVATGTGSTSGQTELGPTPSLSGSSRQFLTAYEAGSGERYSDVFGNDTYTTNFLYDGWVYLAAPDTGLANLELDLNQVIGNGDTMIFAFQCDSYTQTWDYGENSGTVQSGGAQWMHSTQSCNVRQWSTNAWHHVQILESRDDAGNVTYRSVWLDGTEQDINATVPGEFALGWAPVVQTNFQVDGYGASGTTQLYLDNLTVYAW